MDELQEKIFSTFSTISTSLGYSEVHGRIIAALVVNGGPISLHELADATGYSVSAISLSLDLLELVGIIRKIKNVGDRKLYVKLDGDLIQGLRNALILKVQKDILFTLMELEQFENADERSKKMVGRLKREIDSLEEYVKALSNVDVPKHKGTV